MKNDEWVGCPVRYAAGVFADKWSFVILRDVLIHGKRFYGELLESEERISSNILASRLAHFEATGLMTKSTDQSKKTRVIYRPTRKARDLLPALLVVMVWATKYDQDTEAPLSFAAAVQSDLAGAVAWYGAQIDKVDSGLGFPALAA